ncbi:MAG: hypothetical protein GY730_11115 [bacterium]|nr:hypothetical protein [bacterium]
MKTKLATVLIVIFILCNSQIFAANEKSLAEKDEERRIKPKSNTLSRIFGVAAGAGATAIAIQKGQEKRLIPLSERKDLTPKEKEELARKSRNLFDRIGVLQFQYGLSSNFKPDSDKIDLNYMLLRFNHLETNLSLRYENQSFLYNDNSTKSINKYLIEYSLRPRITRLDDPALIQIGALVGGKAVKTASTNKISPTFGVSCIVYMWDLPLSFHTIYYASLVSLSRQIIDSEADITIRFKHQNIAFDIGSLIDFTDTEYIKYQLYAKVGIHF